MSLILEALKKLEREKGAPDRGFLVLAHLPGATAPQRWWVAAAVASLAVIAVVAGGLVWWRAGAGRGPAAPPATAPEAMRRPAAESAPQTPIAAAPATVSAPAPQPRVVAPPREPQRAARAAAPRPAPADSPEPAAVELHLNAISRQDGAPVAIINDRLVREGDSFDGVRILRIGEAEVEVEVRGVRRVIGF